MSWDLHSWKEEPQQCTFISPINYSTSSFHSFTPRQWQVDAYNAWVNANKRATVTASTGSGKTKLAMMVIEKHATESILVVVPTVVLQDQWKEEINSLFPNLTVGLIGNGKNERNCSITVAIVNSIREESLEFDILIMDETHRYASDQNIKFLTSGTFGKVLAITATIKRQDDLHKQIIKDYPIVYTISQKDSIKAGYLSKYIVLNKSVKLTEQELEEYTKHQHFIDENFSSFNNNYPAILAEIQKKEWTEDKKLAIKLNRAFQGRKTVLNNAKNKIEEAVNLVKEFPNNKTIIFNELKQVAEQIYKKLLKEGFAVGLYHSGLKTKQKKEMIEKYTNNEYSIMVTVKALDEGLDVKACDMGILVAGNSTKRQGIQRVGRILRASEGKECAVLYQLYVPETQDVVWLESRLKGLDGASQVVYI